MKGDDKRFHIGWAAVALMFGVSLLVGWISNWDLNYTLAVFFLGLAMILGALAVGGEGINTLLAGFAGFLGIIGIISFLIRPENPNVPFVPLIGGIIIGVALAYMVYTYSRK